MCLAGKQTKKAEWVLTDLKDDDKGQPGSQDVPELQGEFIRHRAPGRCSVVSVPAVSGLAAVLQLAHVKHRQAAVHVPLQAPEMEKETLSDQNRNCSAKYAHCSAHYFEPLLVPVVVGLVHARAVFEGVNKAGDVVWGDGNDKGIGDDCQHADTLENPMPDTWQPKQRRIHVFQYCLHNKENQPIYMICVSRDFKWWINKSQPFQENDIFFIPLFMKSWSAHFPLIINKSEIEEPPEMMQGQNCFLKICAGMSLNNLLFKIQHVPLVALQSSLLKKHLLSAFPALDLSLKCHLKPTQELCVTDT